jgi:hypothetical protein
MDQSTAVWILIGLSLITANLPFMVERPFLAFPWNIKGASRRPGWLLWLTSAVFTAVLAAWALFGFRIITQASFFAGDLVSVSLFMGKLLLVVGGAVVLLGYPGFRERSSARKHPDTATVTDAPAPKGKVAQSPGLHKSFFDRLLELLMFYFLVGALGLAFEGNIGNTFPQRWEFYAITLCLFVVLGYPGFVFRYLMRHTKEKKPARTVKQASDTVPI